MIQVPDKFKPKHPFPYPADNHYEFERWYHDHYSWEPEAREYLPIFWTAYYCKHKFGKDLKAMVELQQFLNKLDRSKKYYTIVQYDNGVIHDLSMLDIKVFSMSGGRTDYPLPLISEQHPYIGNYLKYYTANFIGRMTHPIRVQMAQGYFGHKVNDNFITDQHYDLQGYCAKIAQSTFTLCPRGFGPTSFRIQEALQYGSIPVYISDEFVIPHNIPFDEYGVLIEARDAYSVREILSSLPEEEIRQKQQTIPYIYKQYFTYEGNQKAIKKAVAQCDNPVGDISI